jgi:hypothetical protein
LHTSEAVHRLQANRARQQVLPNAGQTPGQVAGACRPAP